LGTFLIYADGATHLQVRLDGNTVWLTQKVIAELYCVSVKTVNEHLINIYNEAELPPEATIRSFRIVQTESSRQVARNVEHYSLDAILAVGYRVRPARGTVFRQWATARIFCSSAGSVPIGIMGFNSFHAPVSGPKNIGEPTVVAAAECDGGMGTARLLIGFF